MKLQNLVLVAIGIGARYFTLRFLRKEPAPQEVKFRAAAPLLMKDDFNRFWAVSDDGAVIVSHKEYMEDLKLRRPINENTFLFYQESENLH